MNITTFRISQRFVVNKIASNLGNNLKGNDLLARSLTVSRARLS